MKEIKIIFRTVLSPIVFILYSGGMLLFPGTIALLIGIPVLIIKLITDNNDFDFKEHLAYTTCLFWIPFYGAYKFIKYGEMIE